MLAHDILLLSLHGHCTIWTSHHFLWELTFAACCLHLGWGSHTLSFTGFCCKLPTTEFGTFLFLWAFSCCIPVPALHTLHCILHFCWAPACCCLPPATYLSCHLFLPACRTPYLPALPAHVTSHFYLCLTCRHRRGLHTRGLPGFLPLFFCPTRVSHFLPATCSPGLTTALLPMPPALLVSIPPPVRSAFPFSVPACYFPIFVSPATNLHLLLPSSSCTPPTTKHTCTHNSYYLPLFPYLLPSSSMGHTCRFTAPCVCYTLQGRVTASAVPCVPCTWTFYSYVLPPGGHSFTPPRLLPPRHLLLNTALKEQLLHLPAAADFSWGVHHMPACVPGSFLPVFFGCFRTTCFLAAPPAIHFYVPGMQQFCGLHLLYAFCCVIQTTCLRSVFMVSCITSATYLGLRRAAPATRITYCALHVSLVHLLHTCIPVTPTPITICMFPFSLCYHAYIPHILPTSCHHPAFLPTCLGLPRLPLPLLNFSTYKHLYFVFFLYSHFLFYLQFYPTPKIWDFCILLGGVHVPACYI